MMQCSADDPSIYESDHLGLDLVISSKYEAWHLNMKLVTAL